MILLLANLASAAAPLPDCSTSTDPKQAAASAKLVALYEEAVAGQGDPAARVKAVKKLKKQICTAVDHTNAGWLLLGSQDAKDLKWAYDLGQLAAQHHAPKAQQLVTHAYDRWQMSLGAPQRYGTQYGKDGACFWPVEPGFTDEARADWAAPPIADSIATFLKSVGKDGETPNEATLFRYQLLCPLIP